jgi:transmembrane sensor
MNLHNEIDKKANLWMMKENESLSDEEKELLETWLENKKHKEVYDENNDLIQECLALDDEFIQEMQKEVLEEIEKPNFFHRTQYIAACIFVACMVFLGLFGMNTYFEPTFEQNFVTADKKILNIVLPDNSVIDLDIKSHIQISYYRNKRTVHLLSGKALFKVAKNKSKPFLITSGNTLVEVLGTKFEVVNTHSATKVNVVEGRVRVDYIYNDKGDKKALVQLKKAESFTLNNVGRVLNYDKMNIDEIASWKNDVITFDKTTLQKAALIFERYSNQKIEFASHDLSQLTISGKFSTRHYKGFLDAIELIYPIKSQKEGNLIKIVKK